MYHPTTRLLTILELLQSHHHLNGAELAARLEVDTRTVRRYITILQDIGIPIEAEPGRYGGYTLRPGYKLPPLMFSNEEALALALGLQLAGRLGLGADTAAVVGAAAKLERVLPLTLRAQLQALQSVLILDLPLARTDPAAKIILTLATAVQQEQQLRLRYLAWDGQSSERLVDPYGLVYRAGYWYLPAYCHQRQATRTFRVDRIESAQPRETTFSRPPNFDPLAHVNQALATMPGVWPIVISLQTDLAHARRLIPPTLATLDESPGGVILRCYVQSLDWFAHFLAGLNCPLTVHQPAELRTALARLAEKTARLAECET
jgi:predicted DNA-binding transcriptional regulator YafY